MQRRGVALIFDICIIAVTVYGGVRRMLNAANKIG